MKQYIDQAIYEGYRPALFIDDDIFAIKALQLELSTIKKQATELGVIVVSSKDATLLNKYPKLHVFRYGQMPMHVNLTVLRRKGRIVPSPF